MVKKEKTGGVFRQLDNKMQASSILNKDLQFLKFV